RGSCFCLPSPSEISVGGRDNDQAWRTSSVVIGDRIMSVENSFSSSCQNPLRPISADAASNRRLFVIRDSWRGNICTCEMEKEAVSCRSPV
ncbi:unnamed protein product, partial [Larinioides sclopetarius]